jgi:Protein of unknown function (DUF3467)
MEHLKPEQQPIIKKRVMAYRQPKDGIQYFYSNNITVGTTQFDMRIIFGQIEEVNDDQFIVQQNAQVTMAWVEAKILADFLRVNIEDYEKRNGQLKIPDIGTTLVIPDIKYLTAKDAAKSEG